MKRFLLVLSLCLAPIAAADPLPLSIDDLGGGAWALGDGVYQALVLVHDDGVILFDAPPSMAGRMPEAIDALSEGPVTHLVYSHAHTDHTGSASALLGPGGRAEGAAVVAHEQTAALLAERADPRRPLPTLTFERSHELSAGGRLARLDYHGANHQAGNLFAWLPEQKVLMLVDVVFPGWVPFKNLGIAEDVDGYLAAHRQALGYDFETLVAGHVDRPGTRADVERALAFLVDLEAAARVTIAEVTFGDVAAVAMAEPGFEPNPWSLYDAYQDALVAETRARLEPRWSAELAGWATYADDACWRMIEAVQVELAPADPGTPGTPGTPGAPRADGHQHHHPEAGSLPVPPADRTATEVALGFYGLINGVDPAAWADHLANGWVARPSMKAGNEAEGYRRVIGAFRRGVPDLQVETLEVVENGGFVAVRSRLTGTQTGELFGSPATGRRFSITAMDIHRVENGRVVSTWHVEDFAALQEQLGGG